VVRRHSPRYEAVFQRRGWSMLRGIDRIYVSDLARARLGWQPRYDFAYAIDRLRDSQDFRSDLARAVGSKGDHAAAFSESPHTT
jgi:UDP-glucose 4-epimerase